MSTKAELQEEYHKEFMKCVSLQRQVDYLLSEMVALNQGLGVKPDYYTDADSWDTAMKHKAGLAIKKLHEMRK